MQINYTDMDYCEKIEQESAGIYGGSTFEPLVSMSSRSKGAAIEGLVEEFLIENGDIVEPPLNSQHDRIVNGEMIEIKGSSLWKDTETFTWQQIRPNETDWQGIIFVAIYYDRIDIYYDTRDNVLSYPQLHGQHSGNSSEETMWLHSCLPDDFPTWEYLGCIMG